MAATAFVEILSVVSSGMGISQFLASNFGAQDSRNAVVSRIVIQSRTHVDILWVKIGAGFAQSCPFPVANCPNKGTGNRDAKGALGYFEVFNENKDRVGFHNSVSFDAGATNTFSIDTGGRDASYLSITADKNGMCISTVAITYPSGVKHAFVGDWWKLCGITTPPNNIPPAPYPEWYYGNIEAGQTTTNPSQVWYPLCGWMDWDQTCGHRVVNIIVNMAQLQNVNNTDTGALCNPDNMWWSLEHHWPPSSGPFGNLQGIPGPGTLVNSKAKRKNICSKKRQIEGADSLVRSDIWSHNATELCLAHNSNGPDFISLHEGMHCDMDSRQVTPLCGAERTDDDECFTLDEDRLVGRSKIGKRTVSKQYSKILDWKHEDLHAAAVARRDLPT